MAINKPTETERTPHVKNEMGMGNISVEKYDANEDFERLSSASRYPPLPKDFTVEDLKLAVKATTARRKAEEKGTTLQLGLLLPDKVVVAKRPITNIRASEMRSIDTPSRNPSAMSNTLEDKKTEGIILHDLIELAIVRERLKCYPRAQWLKRLRYLYPTASEAQILDVMAKIDNPVPEQAGIYSSGGIDRQIREGVQNPYQPILSQSLATGRFEGPTRRMTRIAQGAFDKYNRQLGSVIDKIPFWKGDMIVEATVHAKPDDHLLKTTSPVLSFVNYWAKPDIAILEATNSYKRVTIFDFKAGRAPETLDEATTTANKLTSCLLSPDIFYKPIDFPHHSDRPSPFTLTGTELLELAFDNLFRDYGQTSVEHITLYLGGDKVVARRTELMKPYDIVAFLMGQNQDLTRIVEKAKAARKATIMQLPPSKRAKAEQ